MSRLARDLVSGRRKLTPRHLFPHRTPQHQHRLAPPLLTPSGQQALSRTLLSLGHSPSAHRLPPPQPPKSHLLTGRPHHASHPLAKQCTWVGRSMRTGAARLAKIAFVQKQMDKMAALVAEWRAKKRASKAAKKKKYPF